MCTAAIGAWADRPQPADMYRTFMDDSNEEAALGHILHVHVGGVSKDRTSLPVACPYYISSHFNSNWIVECKLYVALFTYPIKIVQRVHIQTLGVSVRALT